MKDSSYFIFWGICCVVCLIILLIFIIWFEDYKIKKWSKMIDEKIMILKGMGLL